MLSRLQVSSKLLELLVPNALATLFEAGLTSMLRFRIAFVVSMAISLLVKRLRNVLPYSMGLVFGLYILNAFGSMIGEKSLEIISPFKHFAPSFIIKNVSWDFPLIMISVGLIAISVGASYVLYARRNIASAV